MGTLNSALLKLRKFQTISEPLAGLFQKQGLDCARPCLHWLIMVVGHVPYCLVAAMISGPRPLRSPLKSHSSVCTPLVVDCTASINKA